MRAFALVLVLSLPAPGFVGAAPRSCEVAVAKGFSSCLGRAARALRTGTPGGPCAGAQAAGARLRHTAVARCTEAGIRDAGYPPPFDPSTLAARLAGGCLGNAAALARGVDAIGGAGTRPCLATLATVSARLAVRAFTAASACTLAGKACRTAALKRTAAAEAKACRSATRRCRSARLADGAVAGLLA